MNKQKVEQQIRKQFSDREKFKKAMHYESNWHTAGTIIFIVCFVLFLFFVYSYFSSMSPLLKSSNPVTRERFWTLFLFYLKKMLFQPRLFGPFGYLIIAGEVSLAYLVFWHFRRKYKINQMYERFRKNPDVLSIWHATPINGRNNLIYEPANEEDNFDQAFAALSKEQKAAWEKATNIIGRETNYDSKKIKRLKKEYFGDTFKYIDVLLAYPLSMPFYWENNGDEKWVVGTRQGRNVIYFLHTFDHKGRKVKTSFGEKIFNFVTILFRS